MMHGSAEGVIESAGAQSSHEASFPPISILVAVEIRLYREGLVRSLARHTSLRIVGTAADAGEAITALRQHPPQVVLLDIAMEDSTSLVREVRDVAPETRIIALGMRETERNVLLCAEAGISGYVPRDGTLGEVVAVVESAARGELRCSARMAAALFRRIETLAGAQPPGVDEASLTRREREVVELLDEGASNKEISRRLHIELSTVKNHVHNILTKLQVPRRSAISARTRGPGQGLG
jgi:two-component system, NarL family, nitrate/nitrite response regulator NarL